MANINPPMSKLWSTKAPREPGASCSSYRLALEDMGPIHKGRTRNNLQASASQRTFTKLFTQGAARSCRNPDPSPDVVGLHVVWGGEVFLEFLNAEQTASQSYSTCRRICGCNKCERADDRRKISRHVCLRKTADDTRHFAGADRSSHKRRQRSVRPAAI